MLKLKNYLLDSWIEGEGEQNTLINPSTGEALATASTAGLDLDAALKFAREEGGKSLRAMTFAERGALLKSMAGLIHEHREELIDLGMANAGNTRGDAKFDIDGATGTLAYYASLGKKLGDTKNWLDGDGIDMGQSSRMQGRHVYSPRHGCAIHINAFNFPAWGFAEKAACAILAGMPVVSKPGTLTALMTHRIIELIVADGKVPKGVLSFICGRVGDLLSHADFQDCIAFTGSAETGQKVASHPRVLERGVRVNIEADSLNASILGPDVEDETDTFDLFVRDIVTDMTQKSGQKCTAIRRVFVPAAMQELLIDRLREELARIVIGVPGAEKVRMGPLAGPQQLADAKERLAQLMETTKVALGDPDDSDVVGDPEHKGAFMKPIVLLAENIDDAGAVHEVEVFGPVCTIMPYDGEAETAAAAVALGRGGLVSSFYTDDRTFATSLINAMAPYQGRLVWGSKRVAGAAPGPGIVFPMFTHGGPGRAGGGEELGGKRGMEFYSQRLAIQGYGPLLDRIFGVEN